MAPPNNRVIDGFTSALGGVNNGSHPVLLKPDEIAYGFNVTLRGGYPTSRPRINRRLLTFDNAEQRYWFNTRRLQGADIYHNPHGDQIIVSVEGRIFAINTDWSVVEITPTRAAATTNPFTIPSIGGNVNVDVNSNQFVFQDYPVQIAGAVYKVVARVGASITLQNYTGVPTTIVPTNSGIVILDVNRPDLEQVWFLQAETWFLIQDDADGAILYNGSSCRRAVTTGAFPEVPTGAMMEYAEGRVWVVVNRRYVAAGDLFDPFNTSSVITFSEELQPETFGRFAFPTGDEDITGIRVIPNLDTGQGQGPLLVFTQIEVASINVPVNRLLWRQVQYPITRLVQSLYGGTSDRSLVVVNGDIWNRALDGLRTFIMAAAAFNQWGNVPQSREMQRVISKDTADLLYASSGALFDNRVLMTYGPVFTRNGVRHRGLIVLDFDTISALIKREMPVYDGVWTGVNPTVVLAGLFGGHDHGFIFSLNDQYENELWEIETVPGNDNITTSVKSFVETRSFDFQHPKVPKKLQGAEAWVNDIVGSVTFQLHWKPDFAPCWYLWNEGRTICAKDMDCTVPTPPACKPFVNYNAGYRSRVGFGQPPDDCESFDSKPARLCYRTQLRLQWTGQCSLKDVNVTGDQQPQSEWPDACNVGDSCVASTCCQPDESYSSEGAQTPTPAPIDG